MDEWLKGSWRFCLQLVAESDEQPVSHPFKLRSSHLVGRVDLTWLWRRRSKKHIHFFSSFLAFNIPFCHYHMGSLLRFLLRTSMNAIACNFRLMPVSKNYSTSSHRKVSRTEHIYIGVLAVLGSSMFLPVYSTFIREPDVGHLARTSPRLGRNLIGAGQCWSWKLGLGSPFDIGNTTRRGGLMKWVVASMQLNGSTYSLTYVSVANPHPCTAICVLSFCIPKRTFSMSWVWIDREESNRVLRNDQLRRLRISHLV